MSGNFGPGLHVAIGERVDRSAYDRYVGLWSRLFVPDVLAAAEVSAAHRILDVATGPGEAAAIALSKIGPSGLVVGVDISVAMLHAANSRFADQRFRPVAADGQALPFADGTFDAVICQLGLMFFPSPVRGLEEFRRVLRPHRRAAFHAHIEDRLALALRQIDSARTIGSEERLMVVARCRADEFAGILRKVF